MTVSHVMLLSSYPTARSRAGGPRFRMYAITCVVVHRNTSLSWSRGDRDNPHPPIPFCHPGDSPSSHSTDSRMATHPPCNPSPLNTVSQNPKAWDEIPTDTIFAFPD